MLTVRGWLRADFRPERADNGGKSVEGESVYHLCEVEIHHEVVSDRWYFDIKNDGRFMVREDLKEFVEEWSLDDFYPSSDLGTDSIIYRPKEGVAGTARFDPELNPRLPSHLRIEGVKNLELLREFYYAIRKGEADIDATWNGQGRNNLTKLTERIRALEEELSKAYTTIGTNQEYIGRVKQERDVMRRELDQLDAKIETAVAAEKARADKAWAEVAQRDRDLRDLEESVRQMITSLWVDASRVEWWRSKRRMMRVICRAIFLVPRAFRCTESTDVHAAIKTLYKSN